MAWAALDLENFFHSIEIEGVRRQGIKGLGGDGNHLAATHQLGRVLNTRRLGKLSANFDDFRQIHLTARNRGR